jgi:predicted transposase/invertase (TIGR01784 family)
LQPPSPIESVDVLDPEVRKEQVDDRGIVLDVLARLRDGTRVNIEMQCDRRGAIPARWLYNWARLFSEGIRRGDAYAQLAPVVCIVFLDCSMGRRFHELYRVLEVHDQSPFSDALAIHVIELPRIADAEPPPLPLSRWARFLRTRSTSELQSLAVEDPIMADAKDALERLSEDPGARAMAEARKKAEVYHMLRDGQSREEGRAEGRAEARSSALREMISGFAELMSLPLTPERERELADADIERLEAIATHLRTHRAWPE